MGGYFFMIFQSAYDDCGKAVVRNLVSLVYRDDSFETEVLKSDCRSLLEIRKELERFSLKYVSYEVEELSQVKNDQYPCVALVKNPDVSHFVIIEKKVKNRIYVMDPQFGEYVLDEKEFNDVFIHRMLLLESKGTKPAIRKIEILGKREKVSYVLCFVFQAISLLCFVISTGFQDFYIYSLISFLVLLMMIVLQNALNLMVQKRSEKTLIHPYMKLSMKSDDFRYLNEIMNLEIKRNSNLVSYGVLLFGLVMLLALNSYFLSFLALIPLCFTLFRLLLKKERNRCNRYCSFEERRYLEGIAKKDENCLCHYENARKKGYGYALNQLLSHLFEYVLVLILLSLELYLLDKMNIHLFVYYFCIVTSISVTMNHIYSLYLDRTSQKMKINALSFPLPLFLFKTVTDLKYNIEDKGADKTDEIKKCPRICESGESQIIIEETVHTDILPYFGKTGQN